MTAPCDATGDEDEIAALRARVHELEEAVRARDGFLSVAAHELRNPMTPIAMHTEVLLRQVRAGAPREVLEVGLERQHWLMRRYVARATTLLDVSRAASGGVVLDPVPLDLVAVAREVVDGLAPIATRFGVTILVDAPASLPGRWDRLAIEQVLDNLVSNALKYGAGRPVDVSLGRAGERVVLRVRDRGLGIGQADRARIFERFERVVGRGERAGFGIGLWLVRQLVRAMGGEVDVTSVIGQGSTFEVVLPCGAGGPG